MSGLHASCSIIRGMREFVAFALAVHRLTRLVVSDTITEPLRTRILDKKPPEPTSWTFALTCAWCASLWAGAGLATFWAFTPKKVSEPVIFALAASSITGAIEERL